MPTGQADDGGIAGFRKTFHFDLWHDVGILAPTRHGRTLSEMDILRQLSRDGLVGEDCARTRRARTQTNKRTRTNILLGEKVTKVHRLECQAASPRLSRQRSKKSYRIFAGQLRARQLCRTVYRQWRTPVWICRTGRRTSKDVHRALKRRGACCGPVLVHARELCNVPGAYSL